MTLPRRVPPEPSTAAIEAASIQFGVLAYPLTLEGITLALRAAYAVDAPRGAPVTVEELAARIREVDGHHMLGAGELAEALHAHLVPTETP